MKFVSTILFLLSVVFAVPALADSQGQQRQFVNSHQDLDGAISENWHQVKMDGARLMLESTASIVSERIQLKEQLDADPSNKKLRAKYESALANEKKSLALTKQFILSD